MKIPLKILVYMVPIDCSNGVVTVILEYLEHIIAHFEGALPLPFQSLDLAPPSAVTE